MLSDLLFLLLVKIYGIYNISLLLLKPTTSWNALMAITFILK